MESFRWDEHFETGLKDVDQQHHMLVDLINRYGEMLQSAEAPAFNDVESLLAELNAYAQYHFKEEESLMEQAGVDPRHRAIQQQGHAEFVQEISRLSGEINAGHAVDKDKAEYVLKFLIHWLAYHILGADQAMARQIKAIRAGQKADEAYSALAHFADGAMEPMLRALNGLFHQVSEYNRELIELNQVLEAKVAERTRELTLANQRLEQMALTDVLTGLHNRRSAIAYLDKEWDESLRTGKPLSVIMIDADGFKQINDAYGHDAGDEVLRVLARQLKESVRNDDIVSRLGGDEFLIICADTGLDGAIQLAESLHQSIAGLQVPAGCGIWRGSISVGVAERRHGMESHKFLLKAADAAVYTAKDRGRNCVAW